MKVYRPAGGIETAAAYLAALKENGPTSIILSRQNLAEYNFSKEGALKGGYVLADSEKATPDVLLIATGSEVELAMKAKDELKAQNVDARVISMPCIELFEKQSKKYKESVIPSKVRARVCIEAGSSYSWYRYAGLDGKIIGIDKFGESGPAKKLFVEYGFTAENVVNAALETLNK